MAKQKRKKFGHGGPRKGAGRKPIDDKKVAIPIYPQQSRVAIVGREKIQNIAMEAVEAEYKNLVVLS